MDNLFIFGDSFSFSKKNESWVNLIKEEKKINVINYSTNASSLFRIYKNFKHHFNEIKSDDTVIINYSNYQRIYINDSYLFKTRKKENYQFADLVISDALNLPFFQKIFFKKFYLSIYDDEQQFENYLLIKNEIRNKLKNHKLIEITFFDYDMDIINFRDIWQNNKGDINHMNEKGNFFVFKNLINHI